MPAYIDLSDDVDESEPKSSGADSFINEPNYRTLLDFECECLEELFRPPTYESESKSSDRGQKFDSSDKSEPVLESSLCVFAEGLGIHTILLRVVTTLRKRLFKAGSPKIVAIVGLPRTDEMNASLFRAKLDCLADLRSAAPENRAAQYIVTATGGAVLVKAQALALDILQRRLSLSALAAVLFWRVERVKVDGLEALIAAVLSRHSSGTDRCAMIGFSDAPQSLVPVTTKLRGLMRALSLRRFLNLRP